MPRKKLRHTLIQRVQKGDVQYARRLTRSRTVIVLEHAGQVIAFLYSRGSKEILSFLSLDAPEIAPWRSAQPDFLPLCSTGNPGEL